MANSKGQLLLMSSPSCDKIPTQSTASRHSLTFSPTAFQSTWPRMLLVASKMLRASVLSVEKSPTQSMAPIIETMFWPRVVQSVPCTAPMSVFKRPITNPLSPRPASVHGMFAMAELRQAAMEFPRSAQPSYVWTKL